MKTKLYLLLNQLFLYIEFTYFRHLYDEKEALKKQLTHMTEQESKYRHLYLKFWYYHHDTYIKLRNLNIEVDKTTDVLKKIAGRYEWLESKKNLMYTDQGAWLFANDAVYRMELARDRLKELSCHH